MELEDGIGCIGILILVLAVKTKPGVFVGCPKIKLTSYSLLNLGEYGSTPLCNINITWSS